MELIAKSVIHLPMRPTVPMQGFLTNFHCESRPRLDAESRDRCRSKCRTSRRGNYPIHLRIVPRLEVVTRGGAAVEGQSSKGLVPPLTRTS